MKKACAFLAVYFVCAVSLLFAQGIQSSIVNLPLNGSWRQAVEVEKECTAPGVQVFYDEKTGTLVQLRHDYQLRAVEDISKQFANAGRGTASGDGARILMSTMFPLPSKYSQAIASSIHEGRAPKLWETKDPGNIQWFYVAQLFGGYRVSGGDRNSEIREEYLPMRTIKAEHQSVPAGDVLIFEAETERPAIDASLKRFKMTPGLKDQRLRYGWIQFSPGGITSSESIISVAFATPINSGIDTKSVIDQLVASYHKDGSKN